MSERMMICRQGDRVFQCDREGFGSLRLTLEKDLSKTDQSFSLMSTFLDLGVQHEADGLVLERKYLTERQTPVLVCYPEGAERLPLIIFQHGFTGYKELDLHYGVKLAKEGFLVILPDARYHGERKPDDFNQYFADDFPAKFLIAIRDTVRDISALLDLFERDPRVDMQRVGMTGVSMGGFISFLMLCMDPRVKVAAPMIASPGWAEIEDGGTVEKETVEELRQFAADWEPVRHPERFYPKPILIQNGVEDSVVPINGSRVLYQRLKGIYANTPERIKMVEYPGVGHVATDEMCRAMVEWFKKFL